MEKGGGGLAWSHATLMRVWSARTSRWGGTTATASVRLIVCDGPSLSEWGFTFVVGGQDGVDVLGQHGRCEAHQAHDAQEVRQLQQTAQTAEGAAARHRQQATVSIYSTDTRPADRLAYPETKEPLRCGSSSLSWGRARM